MLGEPGYRTVTLPAVDAVEGLSLIVREGLSGRLAPRGDPLLAAALTEPPVGTTTATPGDPLPGVPTTGGLMPVEPASGLFDRRDPDWLLSWWQAYVGQVAPPVLHALFSHGIVFEPHLQNVLIGVDGDGLPVQAFFATLKG